MLRAVTVGGSSLYFFGTAWEPPHDALRAHGLDLRADAAALRAELRPAPLPPELMGPRARLVMDSARDLGFEWQPLPKFVDQGVLRRDGLGAWGAARWNARRFVDDAVAAGARLVTGATVTRVGTRAGAVVGVEARVGRRNVQVATDTVVLAAGGLGSPMVLRASGIGRAGERFFYDPVQADRAVLARGTAEARSIVRHAGGRSIVVAGHVAVHGGTAKVGDVVDTDLQTEIRGLYVGDASVIPFAWGLPPTFTVMALGRLLGRRLAGVAAEASAEG